MEMSRKLRDTIDIVIDELSNMSDEEFDAELNKYIEFESEIYTAVLKKLEEIV
jgi:hypothetical protein